MKIFIAYGYNDRDKWIREMVPKSVRAFGSDSETGEETYNGPKVGSKIMSLKIAQDFEYKDKD